MLSGLFPSVDYGGTLRLFLLWYVLWHNRRAKQVVLRSQHLLYMQCGVLLWTRFSLAPLDQLSYLEQLFQRTHISKLPEGFIQTIMPF